VEKSPYYCLVVLQQQSICNIFFYATISYEIWRSFKARGKQFSEFVSPFLDLPPSKTPQNPCVPLLFKGKSANWLLCAPSPLYTKGAKERKSARFREKSRTFVILLCHFERSVSEVEKSRCLLLRICKTARFWMRDFSTRLAIPRLVEMT